jgi:NAD(P)-dependent dehydrogenase (short-subunit alcohol dehydrogenase family)
MAAAAISDTTGRRALVTGGADGIGWAVVKRLADAGYRVAIADIDAVAAEARIAALGGSHIALGVDLTDGAAARGLPARAAEALGGLDVVVNNAGMTDTSGRTLIALPEDRFAALVALNLVAVETICGAALELLPEGGAIVNLASGAAFRPLALRGPYSATKAGVVELTRALAPAGRARGVAVSAIAPGYTLTPLVESLEREGRVDLAAVARSIPMGRIATADDIARTVTFAAKAEAAAMAGATLGVDGGGALGTPVEGTAPEPGEGDGVTVVLGADSLAREMDACASLRGSARVAHVIDAALLGGTPDMAEALTHLRESASFCINQAARAADFALTIVVAEGESASERAACAAVTMLVRTFALEWAPTRLRVNAIVWRGESSAGLAPLCAFLGGPDAGFVTGQVIEAGY